MSNLKILPLGGMGNVTQNMFVYEYEDEILIVDCGIGFPDIQMLGVDVLIPDTRYLHDKVAQGKKIVGMILTHGHDDHIAATPYVLPEFDQFPIYASPLTAGFAENRMKDGGIAWEITVVKDAQWFTISEYFQAMPVKVTHSVPDTRHYAIKTPVGVIYHGSDFKLDRNPIDGVQSDLETVRKLGQEGILCQMVDCLRVEKREWVKSESEAGPVIEREMESTRGKCIVTLMSSHIHRIQQTVDAAEKVGRKVVFIGRSVEQNVEVAMRLNKLKVPGGMIVEKRDMDGFKDEELCIIIAGSQGQEGSSLVRAVYGEHPMVKINSSDKVLFSADAIPGNEIPYFQAIDELCRNGVEVVYPDVEPNIHQSGHASAPEQMELVKTAQPKYVMPIGGADRHRVKFVEYVAEPIGYKKDRVLLPDNGEVIAFTQDGRVVADEHIEIIARTVDGLGIGDVGPRVLSDRKALSEAGIIVVVIPRVHTKFELGNIEVVSRGFVFMKEADEVMAFIKKTAAELISSGEAGANDAQIKKTIEKKLSKQLYKIIRREPIIVGLIVDV